jgi:hypothetical protein
MLRTRREVDRQNLKQACIRLKKIWYVGGGDIHYLRQIESFAKDVLGKTTTGMTEELINSFPKGRLNLKVSSTFLDEKKDV